MGKKLRPIIAPDNSGYIEKPKPSGIQKRDLTGLTAESILRPSELPGYSTESGYGKFGESKYDTQMTSEYFNTDKSGKTQFEYLRGERQPWYDKAANGVVNMSGRAVTSAAEGIINPFVGTFYAIKDGKATSFYDNPFTKLVDDADKQIKSAVPFYSTQREDEAHGFEKLMYGNTLWRDVLDGVGYSAGAIMSGNAYTKAFTALGKTAMVGKSAEYIEGLRNIENATDKVKFIENTNKLYQVKDGLKNGVISGLGAMAESSANARSDKNEFRSSMTSELEKRQGFQATQSQKDYIESLAEDAGNSSFALNMPIIMLDNWITFGKSVFGNKVTDAINLKGVGEKVSKEGFDDVYKLAKKSNIDKALEKTYGARKFVEPMIAEGFFQEQSQYGITKGVNDYYKKRFYNPEAASFIDSFSEGVYQAYGTKEGWDQGLIGALSGGLMGNASTLLKEGAKAYADPNIVNSVPEALSNLSTKKVYSDLISKAMRHGNLVEEQKNALENNDTFSYENAKNDDFINYASTKAKYGKTEDLINELNQFKSMSEEEFKSNFGNEMSTDEISQNKQTVAQFVEDKINKVKQVQRAYSAINERFPNASDGNKERLAYSSLTIDNAKNRKAALNDQVKDLISRNIYSSLEGTNPLTLLGNNYLAQTPENKIIYKDALKNSAMNPMDIESALDKIGDIEKLEERESQFSQEYRELMKEHVQAANDIADKEAEEILKKSNAKSATVKKQYDNGQDVNPLDAAGNEDEFGEEPDDIDAILRRSKTTTKAADAPKGPEVGDEIVVMHNSIKKKAEVTNVNLNDDGSIDSVDYEVPSDKAEGETETPEEAAARTGNSKIFSKQKDDKSNDDSSKSNQSKVDLSTTPDAERGQESEKFGEVVSVEADKTKKKSFVKKVIDAVKSLIKKNENIDNHITLKVVEITDSKGNKHRNVGIFLDGENVGFVNGLATDDFTIDLIKTVKADPSKTFTTKDLGIRFGLTDGSLDLVPNGEQQPLIKDLNIDLALTGGQHLIYDFKSRQEGEYTSGSFVGDIDESLFQPGVEIDENAIPKNLGRYVLIVPMSDGVVKYVRVRPAKLDQLSNKATDKIFDEIINKAEDVKSKEVDRADLSNFNTELNDKFFIAVDSKLKIDGVNYDSYSVTMAVTAGNAKGEGKGKIRITLEGFLNGANSSKVVKHVFVNTKNLSSIDQLLNNANKELGTKLSRADLKASISPKNAVSEMTSAVSVDIIKSQQLVFAKVSGTSSVNNTAKSDIDNETGVKTGIYPSKTMIAKGVKLGFSTENVVDMSAEERKIVKSATSKDDVKDLLDKYVKAASVSDIEAKKADIERRKQDDLKIAKRNFEFLNKDYISKLEENTNVLKEQYNFQKSELLKNTNDLEFVESKYGKTFEDWIPLQIKWLKENKASLLLDSRNSESRDYKILNLLQEKNEAVKKINAKYDAELAALEGAKTPAETKQSESVAADLRIQLSGLIKQKEALEKDINSNPKDVRNLEKQITATRNELTKAELNEPKGPSAFKMEDSNGKPLSQDEIDEVKAMLPNFINIEDINKIINNLRANKIPLGVFKDGLIYLNSKTATKGTAYHEAFHAVFRMLLTDREIQKYLNEAQKEYISKHGSNALNQIKKDISRLRALSPEYAALSSQELEELVYEEHMANKWEGFKKDEKAKGPFRRLFIMIKNLVKMFSYHSEEIEALFQKISDNAFSNSEKKNNRFSMKIGMPVYKLIPAGTEEVYDELTGDVSFKPVSHTQKKSNKLISTFAAKINKAKRGDYGRELASMSDDQLFDHFVNERIADIDSEDFYKYANSVKDKSPEAYKVIRREANKELNTYEDNDYRNVLREQVNNRLEILNYEVADDKEAQVNENNDVSEKFSSQDSWLSGGHDSLPKIIKDYISFSTYMEYDPIIGKETEVAVDAVTAYNGLTRVLADVPKSNMINKLQSVAENNPNIKAVLNRLMEDTGMVVNDDNTISQPTKNFNDYQMFLNAFDGSLTTQLFTLVDDKNNFSVTSANTNNPKKLSVENWKSSINYMISTTGVTRDEIASRMNDVVKEMNNGSKSKMNATQLSAKVNSVKSLMDSTGIKLSKGYIEYSLIAAKVENGVELTKKQQLVYDMNSDIMPFKTSLLKGEEAFSGLAKMIKDGKDIFSSDERVGAKGDLEALAEANGMFDESIGNASFKNAQGKSVYEIIKSSYVLAQAKKMNSESFLKKLLSGKDKNNDLNDRNYKMIKNNYLLNNHKDIVQDLKINIIDGLRHQDEEEGTVFGDYDGRTYLAQALAMFATKGEKKGTAKYIFRQNEASNTAYVAELPFMKLSEKGKANKEALDILFKNFKNEVDRIERETNEFDKSVKYKGYNDTKSGRAFDLTEFAYIKDINEEFYNEIVNLAKNGKTSDISEDKVKEIIAQYLNEGIDRYIDNLEKFGVIYKKDGDLRSNYIPNNFFGKEGARYGSIREAISEHYLNDYIMSNSLNELLDGDYALSRKDKNDISKRNKGAMGSGNSYGSGTHRVAYIKDIDSYIITEPIDGNIQRVEKDEKILQGVNAEGVKYEYVERDGKEYEVSKITTNDAQSYQSITHKIFALHALGKLDNKVWDIYKKIIKSPNRNNVATSEISDNEQAYLEKNKASLNPDKTVTFGMGVYHKTSEHSLDRGVISYVEPKNAIEFDALTDDLIDLLNERTFDKENITEITKKLTKLYSPMPGMEYHHNIANQMDVHGIDQVITESASKGATLMPVNSEEEGFNLSNSMTDVLNDYKRLQVETPTGKDEITDGSQLIQLIDSEQDDKMIVNIAGKNMSLGEVRKQYRSLMSESRKNSFKAAMTYIKDVQDGKVDISKLNAKLIRTLEASGADESLLELFSKPYNFNMVNMVDKAEQVVLAHFSKGVLAQKVNGTKVSLVSDAGVKVVIDENDNVVPYQEVAKDPAKYKNYRTRELAHNKLGKDGKRFSECLLSERVLTKHGLKVGDEIPQELLEGLGYRIPTDDKHSMIALKIVGLLPKTMEGAGIFPQEIIHLSGADFDIDSEFIQLHDYWMKDGKAIKYGTETSIDDKWASFIYYKLHSDNDFKHEFDKNLDIIKDVYKSMEMTLKEFGLPTSIDEFSKLENPEMLNNGVINNMILDRRIAMLTNDNMLKDIAYSTTSTDKIKNVSDKIDSIRKKNSKYKISDKNISASDINGKFDANVKNSMGKNGIGIIANKIQNFNVLAKVGSKIKEDGFRYMIGGHTAEGYTYINKDGERISDVLSSGLQVMTDNAKDPIAGRLGLSMELLPGWSELIAQGLPEYEASLLINLPALQIYSENKKISSYSLQNDVEKGITKSKTLKYTVSKVLGIDYKLVTDKMIASLKEDMKNLSTKDMEGVISGEITDPVQLQEIQINALMQFSEIEKYSDLLSNVNTFLKLNQGLDTSFIDLQQRLDKAMRELGIVVNYKDGSPVGLSADQDKDLPIDIISALKNDKLTTDNVLRALKVLERGSKIFISQTKTFKDSIEKLKDILGPSYSNKAGSMRDVNRSMLGFIATKAYKQLMVNMINDPSVSESIKDAYAKRLDNINNSLIYKIDGGKTLGQQLTELKNSPDTRISQNSLITYLQSTPDEDGILDIVSSKSFVKESPENISVFLDSFKDLYNNKETRDFAINMFNYLIVKDNLEFKSGSFVKFIAPFMFDKLSQALDVTLDEFNKKDNIQEKKTLGDTFGKIAYDFRKSFATYIGNQYGKLFYKTLEGKEGWDKDASGNIMFNSRNSDGTTDEKGRDYLESIFETESKEYVSKKTGEKGVKTEFIFPQFAMFNKKLYELVSYKEFDKTIFHDLTQSKHIGTSANYTPLEFVGNKKVSPYPLGYESNVATSKLEAIAKKNEASEYDVDQMPPDDFEKESLIDAAVNKQSKIAQIGNIGSESVKFDEAKPKSKYSLSSDVESELAAEKLQESEKSGILNESEFNKLTADSGLPISELGISLNDWNEYTKEKQENIKKCN